MPQRIAALVIKELLAILRDPRGRTVLIMPPLMQLVIFAFAATQEVRNVSLVVLDEDRGKWSFELVQRFRGSPTFEDVRYLNDLSAMRAAIDAQRAIVALHIQQNFSRDVEAGRPAQVQLILDGRQSNAAQIVLGYATSIIDRMNEDLAARESIAFAPAITVPRNWFNANLEYRWFTVPSLVGLLTMVIGLIVTALSVARERELGTFDQLLVSPLRPVEILVGKTVPALLIGIAEGTLIVSAAVLFFSVPFTGSLFLLYASMVVFLAAVIGVGLFISALSATQQQAILGAFAFASPAILLSGFVTPIENVPAWLQPLTQAIPLSHFLIVLRGVFLKAMPAETVFANTWPMALIAVFTLAGAAWFFRRRLQ